MKSANDPPRTPPPRFAGCAALTQPHCLYCRMPLVGHRSHEHDHFPIADRHKGQEAWCVCVNCHDLKDRGQLMRLELMEPALLSLSEKLTVIETLKLEGLVRSLRGDGVQALPLAAFLERWPSWELATGTERIALAILVDMAHDAFKRFGDAP